MLFNKKQSDTLISEVDNSRRVVYTYRRRTRELFENFRPVSYQEVPGYSVDQFKQENTEVLARLIANNAVDAGNEDCLVDRILGPVRDGIRYLDDQHVEHMDFFIRQAKRMSADSSDLGRLIEAAVEKEAVMEEEHKITQALWDRYCGYSCVNEEEKQR